MKEIIVAIDFSKGSLHALDYAIAFANHVKSNVMMVWVDGHVNQDSVFSTDTNEFRDEAVKNMDEIMRSRKGMMKLEVFHIFNLLNWPSNVAVGWLILHERYTKPLGLDFISARCLLAELKE